MTNYKIGDRVTLDPTNFNPTWYNNHAKGRSFKILDIQPDVDGDSRYYLDGIPSDGRESNILEADLILHKGLKLVK